MDKKVLSAVCLLVGSSIGAGFATGKEIIVFFSKFGLLSIPNSLLFGVLFGVVIYVFMMIGKNMQVKGFSQATSLIMGKGEKACNVFILVMLVCLIASMFGGTKEILAMLVPNHYLLYYFLFFIIMSVLAFSNLKCLSLINKLCVPCIILYLLSFVMICPYKHRSILIDMNVAKSILSCIYYTSLNVMIAGFVMMSFSYGMSKKQIKQTCFIGGTMITVLLLLVALLFLFCGEGVVRASVPVLTLAYSQSKSYGLLGLGVIIIAIITTLLSNQFCFKNFLLERCKSKVLASLLPISVGFLLSFIGFEKIIGYCYPIIGCIGIFFSIRLCYFYFKTDKG